MTVFVPRWARLRKHPAFTGLVAAALLIGLGAGGSWGYGTVFGPPLSCGAGMTAVGSPPDCVGLDLSNGPLRRNEPARMRGLEEQVKAADDEVSGPYESVVLLLDLTPHPSVDTVSYATLYPNLEGAVTALWRADHTGAYGTLPKVKLFLANMGSQYRYWRGTAQRIAAERSAYHLDAVIGLAQSTSRTQAAATYLTGHHIPVIGSTVTGDTMNIASGTHRRMDGFFRVSPTNTETVRAAARFVDSLPTPPESMAVVQDAVKGDDYTSTLVAAADRAFLKRGHPVDQLSFTSPTTAVRGVERVDELLQRFNLLMPNLCQAAPQLIYFAGRGEDLGAFLGTIVQDGGCGLPAHVTVITGDDGADSIQDPAVTRAIASHRVSLYFTTLASPDEWSGTGCGDGVRFGYEEFRSAFTGGTDPCTGQRVSESGTPVPRLAFAPADLDNGQAMLTHDSAVAAFDAIREGTLPQAPAGTRPDVLSALRSYHCASMLRGASGYVAFGTDGNPVDKPIPVVGVSANGTITTEALEWPHGPLLNGPKTRQRGVPGC